MSVLRKIDKNRLIEIVNSFNPNVVKHVNIIITPEQDYSSKESLIIKSNFLYNSYILNRTYEMNELQSIVRTLISILKKSKITFTVEDYLQDLYPINL